ncbi:hypothetical protein LIER_34498 [Lithospermum erythrorhizon]|uniref:Germin-like protein n=1 Tax=Lithospermum erythrorhizon TaxID=34254 RepID=A0AAV3S220_LITER
MFCMMRILFLLISIHFYIISAFDSDPLQDYCIPHTPIHFLQKCITSHRDFKATGFASIPVSSNVFPGLNILGMSFVRADFDVDGINVPHYHPRATETAFVLEGRIYSGFIDTGYRLFAKVIEKGEVMVFPKGLIHFQMNIGDSPATIVGSFNSQNPGLVKVPSAVFGTSIKEELLMKAFGLDKKELAKLNKGLS